MNGWIKERGGVKRGERRELEKIDNNNQKLGNQLLNLWREKKANCGHTRNRHKHLQNQKWKETHNKQQQHYQ